MGKVSEFICEAFEDICIAEKAHRETGDINVVRDHLKKAYSALANYDGTIDRWCMKSNIDLWDAWSVERWIYEHAMNCCTFVIENLKMMDIFTDYRNEYFSA